jgi:hypothetical protein
VSALDTSFTLMVVALAMIIPRNRLDCWPPN